MAGRSTIDHIFALRQMIEKGNEHNRTLYIAFVDFKAAFDSRPHIPLGSHLHLWHSPKLYRLLEFRQWKLCSCRKWLVWMVLHCIWCPPRLCGCPDLFNSVIDNLMCQLKTNARPSFGIDLDNRVSPTWTTPMTLRYILALFWRPTSCRPYKHESCSHDDLPFFCNHHSNEPLGNHVYTNTYRNILLETILYYIIEIQKWSCNRETDEITAHDAIDAYMDNARLGSRGRMIF